VETLLLMVNCPCSLLVKVSILLNGVYLSLSIQVLRRVGQRPARAFLLVSTFVPMLPLTFLAAVVRKDASIASHKRCFATHHTRLHKSLGIRIPSANSPVPSLEPLFSLHFSLQLYGISPHFLHQYNVSSLL